MVDTHILTYTRQAPAVTVPMTETPDRHTVTVAIHSLRAEERIPAAKRKYARAVEMYATTDLSIREIASSCGVSPGGLSDHIGKYHRNLLLARYGLSAKDKDVKAIKVKAKKGQSQATYMKYKEAIRACSDLAYIEYNVSQIAQMFGLDGTGLSYQLHIHYQEVIPYREKLRSRLGVADNVYRGVRPWSVEAYSDAVRLYRDTDMSIPEVAERCNVSPRGLSKHLRYYHKDIIEFKEQKRIKAKRKAGSRPVGKLSGNGTCYGPKPDTVAKYASSMELYQNTPLTIKEIVARTGVPLGGFTGYLHQWHRGDKLRRRGYEWDGESDPDLSGTRHYLKSTAYKYSKAIESLRAHPRHVSEVASEFGFNAGTFREYLRKHEPELVAQRGMTRLANGKLVKRTSEEKYGTAVKEYATSAEPLKSIAKRHGIVYNSIVGYVIRNCPDERESHRRLVKAAEKAGAADGAGNNSPVTDVTAAI